MLDRTPLFRLRPRVGILQPGKDVDHLRPQSPPAPSRRRLHFPVATTRGGRPAGPDDVNVGPDVGSFAGIFVTTVEYGGSEAKVVSTR